MEKYAIYSYKLTEKESQGNTLFSSEDNPISKLSLGERFELIFGKEPGASVNIQKFMKNRTSDKYPCKVLKHTFNIILLRIENKKKVAIWEKTLEEKPIPMIEKKTRPSNPYCYVIIDNRENFRQIIIQSGSAAWKNTNDVKDLLQESLNWIMTTNDYGTEIRIKSKMQPSKFWEYVDMKRKKENVYIKSLVFSFTNHIRRPDIDVKKALSSEWKHFDSFMSWVDRLGGDRGEFKIMPPKNEALMKRKLADIKHMVEICANNNYGLSITFSDDVTYKCNQELRAEFPMEEIIRLNFEQGYIDLFINSELLIWLNDVKSKTKDYDEIEEVRPKPGRKLKQKVS